MAKIKYNDRIIHNQTFTNKMDLKLKQMKQIQRTTWRIIFALSDKKLRKEGKTQNRWYLQLISPTDHPRGRSSASLPLNRRAKLSARRIRRRHHRLHSRFRPPPRPRRRLEQRCRREQRRWWRRATEKQPKLSTEDRARPWPLRDEEDSTIHLDEPGNSPHRDPFRNRRVGSSQLNFVEIRERKRAVTLAPMAMAMIS